MGKQTRAIRYDFRGELGFADAGSGVGQSFVKALTGSASVSGLDGGGVRLAHDATNEVQNACLYMGDVLPFKISEIISISIIAKCSALNAASQIAFGLCSARNNDIDTIAEAAVFRQIGEGNLVVETDDGVNNVDDIATGLKLADEWRRFEINFAERISTMEPPSVSKGRGSNISFYGANDHGSLRRVASGQRFDMSNYSGSLQLFAQIQKTADVNTDSLDILEMCIEVNQAA